MESNIRLVVEVCNLEQDFPILKEFADASYAATMPGNIEAYLFAIFGGAF